MKLIVRKTFRTLGAFTEVSIAGEQYKLVTAWDAEKKTNPNLEFKYVQGKKDENIKAFDFDGVTLYSCYNSSLNKRMPFMLRTSDLKKVDVIPSVNKNEVVEGLAFSAILS